MGIDQVQILSRRIYTLPGMDHLLLALDLRLLYDQHDQRNAKGLTTEERVLWRKEVVAALRATAAMLPSDSVAGIEAFDVAEFYDRHKAHPPSREERLKWASRAAKVCLDGRRRLRTWAADTIRSPNSMAAGMSRCVKGSGMSLTRWAP